MILVGNDYEFTLIKILIALNKNSFQFLVLRKYAEILT